MKCGGSFIGGERAKSNINKRHHHKHSSALSRPWLTDRLKVYLCIRWIPLHEATPTSHLAFLTSVPLKVSCFTLFCQQWSFESLAMRKNKKPFRVFGTASESWSCSHVAVMWSSAKLWTWVVLCHGLWVMQTWIWEAHPVEPPWDWLFLPWRTKFRPLGILYDHCRWPLVCLYHFFWCQGSCGKVQILLKMRVKRREWRGIIIMRMRVNTKGNPLTMTKLELKRNC